MREREGFLDKLKVAAACAVVLLHTITGATGAVDITRFPFENRVCLAAFDLVCWCVPLFVMISGYLFLNPKRKLSMRDMLAKYCRRILLALFLFGVPYACMEQIALEKTFGISMLGKGFLMVLRGESWAHMWYLYLILFLYLLTPGIKWLLERIPRPAAYALAGALAVVSSILPRLAGLLQWEYPAALLGGLVYLFYYLCGYFFAVSGSAGGKNRAESEGRGGEKAARGKEILAWMLPAAAAALALGMAAGRLSGIDTVQKTYNDPLVAALALLLFGTGCVWARRGRKSAKNTGFWKQAAALTFAVYLIHPVFLNFFYKILKITPLDFEICVSLPLFFLGTLSLSFAAAWVLRRIPVLGKYVL